MEAGVESHESQSRVRECFVKSWLVEWTCLSQERQSFAVSARQ